MVSKIFFFLATWWVGYFFTAVQEFFFYYICAACNFFLPTSACRKFFFKITHPLPQELNGRPLILMRFIKRIAHVTLCNMSNSSNNELHELNLADTKLNIVPRCPLFLGPCSYSPASQPPVHPERLVMKYSSP